MILNRMKLEEEVIKIRRDLHQIPEVGFEEVKTSRYIEERLIEYGYKPIKVAKTGLIVHIKGNSKDRAIAFRSDIDGLKMVEKNDIEYKSKHTDKMHACGHDGHMAILLGFAKYLSQVDNIKRDIVLIFQPAEEGPGGAKVIVDDGLLEKYNIEYIFGLHIFPEIKEGKVGVCKGPMMAQTGELDIKIMAKSGHGAIPHKAIDGIYVASQLITSYQSIISRNTDPIDSGVLTIGKIKGGEARNIIAEDIQLEGIIRTFNNQIYSNIKGRINEINEGLEKMYNVKIKTEIRDMYPAVNNDAKLFDEVIDVFNKDDIIHLKPMMIAEDFAFYQQRVPGFFFMLGSGNEDENYINSLHSSKFNFNEHILIEGVKTYINICNKFFVL
ncbi:M20 metallopeptidase family protein [Anaeromonas frigoriresistens]|nr:M20 family metallopeptidase [Anaeromonas frigoriresistens]